jgi:hypothetical protein
VFVVLAVLDDVVNTSLVVVGGMALVEVITAADVVEVVSTVDVVSGALVV